MSKQVKQTAIIPAKASVAKAGGAKPKKAIFNARDVAAHLGTLRQAAIEVLHQRALEAARAAATEAGQEFNEETVEVTEEEIAKSHWWAPVLSFVWASARKGNNGSQWVSTQYRDGRGVEGPLVIRINGERHSGTIMPTTDEGVAELAARVKNPNVVIKKRDKKPSIQIQKWASQVKTLDDGFTIPTDAEGRPILPSDESLSPYYAVASLVNEAFVSEASERIERGNALLATARGEKVVLKANFKPQAAIDAYVKLHGARFPGDMILSGETLNELRKLFPNPEDLKVVIRGAIQTVNVKVAKLIQETIGLTSTKNVGMLLPNPMTRIAMNFDQTTGMAQMAFFDKDKPYDANGQQKYDIGKIDDDPINAENVHKFIRSRATLDGIVNMDSVCFSSMGISMPVKADVLVVEQPKGRETTLDDVYDDDGGVYGAGDALLAIEGGESVEGGEAAPAAVEPAEAPQSAPPQPSAPAPAARAPAPAARATAPPAARTPAAATPAARAPATKAVATKTSPAGKPAAKAAQSAPPTEENYTELLSDLSS